MKHRPVNKLARETPEASPVLNGQATEQHPSHFTSPHILTFLKSLTTIYLPTTTHPHRNHLI